MKKLLALLMAGVIVLSFAACGGKEEEETTIEETTVEDVVGREVEQETEVVTEIVTNDEGETEIVTEIVTVEEETEADKPTEGQAQDTPAAAEDPSKWSTAEVLKYYQDATAKVVSKKPGYAKSRSTDIKKDDYKAGLALSAFKSVVFGFLGVGAENEFKEVVPKGQNTNDDKCGDYLKKSTLAAGDVTSAKAVKSGSNYVITINVKSGSSQIEEGKNSKNNSPIDKTGICIGTTDRSGFDHKSAPLCYAAIGGTLEKTSIYEKTFNGKVVATIDAATGEISKLVISWDASADIDTNLGDGEIVKATTTVTYSKFGW